MHSKAGAVKKHPIASIALLVFVLFLFTEVSLRVVFAFKDYPVGKLAPSWLAFKPIDSLEVWASFYMDENGIYKANCDYWSQPQWNINSEGFRGREFIPDTQNDSSVALLFVGDSFTWGAHATPPDSCFVDLLEREPHLVCYNAGIPGADPAQYAQVARVYVPRLRPDYTLVMLYLGNDLMDTARTIIPGKNIYYQTSAGWLPVSYKGKHFVSAHEAYNFVVNKYSPHSMTERIILKTAIGTALLSLPLRLQEYAEWNRKKNSSVTNDYLRQIQRICGVNDSRLLIFIIPREEDLNNKFYDDPQAYIRRHYPALTQGLAGSIFVIPFRREHLYPLPDGHLNNAGHAFAARFIMAKL
ncbi:MAG TPA: SGNH/GDSL hydrolase family protein [Chitinophagales bacterium]|nr:SGNH/GDSL hydrolase family protein [Chitinophagales bacterium]